MELKGSPRHSPLRALNLLSRAIVLFYFRSFHAQPLNASRPRKGLPGASGGFVPFFPTKKRERLSAGDHTFYENEDEIHRILKEYTATIGL